MGFYSTLPSSSLNRKLEKMGDCQFKVYDSERIEHVLLSTVNGVQLAKRYFPQSMTRWQATFSFQATIIIEGDIQRLDPTGRARIQLTIAEVLGLHYDDIRIVRLDPGSIKVRFQAPIRALPQFLSPVTQKELSGRLKAHESRDTRVLVDDGFQFAQLGERALFLSLYPVTAQQFARFSRSKLVLPVKSGLVFTESEVASVRSRDAYLFCNWLQSSLDGRIRLPTEYEWEFAARSDRFNDAYNDFVRENSGNIWEWCQDSFQNAQRPVAVKRVLRGGNWLALKDADPVASRLQTGGFRVLLDFTNEEENKQLVGE
jgi:hypothetical protein